MVFVLIFFSCRLFSPFYVLPCGADLINFCDKNPLSEMEDPVFRRKMCVSIAMVKCMFSNLGTPRRLTVEQVFDELLLV